MADTNLISIEAREDFIKGVHSGKYGPGVIPPAIYLRTGEILMEEVFKGFGKSFFEETIAKGDLDWLVSAHKNVFLFSGAKTQRQAIDLAKSAVDIDGYLKPFKEYKKTALEIDRAYNLNWLRTEMSTAFALSQSASQWKDIERVREVFTHLKYITKEDGHVRQSHRPLNDIIRPVDDPFWDTHFPPVDWNCRCTFEQLMREEVPKRVGRIDKTVKETPSPLFRFNPGKKGIVFDKSHPYFEEVLAKYPYLNDIVPPTPKPPITQVVTPDPPKQKIPGPPMSPQLYDTIKEELGDEFEDFDQRAIQLASKEREAGRVKINFTSDQGGSYYHPIKREVVIAKKTPSGRIAKRWANSNYKRKAVIYHELGHSIHYELGVIGDWQLRDDWRAMFVKHEKSINARTKIGKARRSELSERTNKLGYVSYESNFGNKLSIVENLKKEGFEDLAKELPKDITPKDFSEMLGGFSDSFGSLTKGKLGGGHSVSYYRQGNNRHMEHFAHAMENYFEGNPVFKYLAPDWYDDTRDFIEKLLKENDIPTS